jgi:hypothetical protein
MDTLAPRPDPADIKAWKQRTGSLIRKIDELCKRLGARALFIVHRPGMPQAIDGYLTPNFLDDAEQLLREHELQDPTDFISVRAQERQSSVHGSLPSFSPPPTSTPASLPISEPASFRVGTGPGDQDSPDSRAAKRPRRSTNDRAYFVKLQDMAEV